MTSPADLPLDDDDQAVLDRLAEVYARLDPPPPDLDERVSFAVALAGVDAEVARLSEQLAVGSGARGSERTRTITFDADSRTVMITIADQADGLIRLDGWLAPGADLRVELRMPEPAQPRIVIADAAGRFAFDGVPHGMAQLLVHPPAGVAAPRVVTPAFSL
jgi:hypothetical protein